MAVESRIGPYSIIRLIKRGGQGQVYLGYDRRLRRRVAIKIHRLPDSRRERRRMLREAQQVASIQSPRVVQIHDVIESREHLAMVMEYVPGCDLEELLREQRLSVASALTIGKDLAAALASARQQRLVHGDLKTSNVLVTEGGRAKLTDFGIARSADEPGYAESAGSLSALSPEQLQGRTLDVRTDLFALGCVMYRTLCGVHPFYRNDQFDARMLLEEEPVPLQERVPPEIELPAELVQLVAELLQKNPDDRPANTHRVRRLLRSASKQLPLATTDSLLREARPCFRAESQEDIPPRIPSGLRGRGRSRLDAGRWRDRFLRLRWSARLGLASLGILGLGVPLVYALQQAPLRVYFEAPLVNVVDARTAASRRFRCLAG